MNIIPKKETNPIKNAIEISPLKPCHLYIENSFD